ncbi:MAG: hypothetical protein MZV64_73190 [Ignavibacteriales bacterium]|nr:hypothetical protein [Ignavibacteriales bacterium]
MPASARRASGRPDGGADIGPSVQAGKVPSMSLDVDGALYFTIHHTEADTIDKIEPTDIARCVAALAVMGYVVADLPARLGQYTALRVAPADCPRDRCRRSKRRPMREDAPCSIHRRSYRAPRHQRPSAEARNPDDELRVRPAVLRRARSSARSSRPRRSPSSPRRTASRSSSWPTACASSGRRRSRG